MKKCPHCAEEIQDAAKVCRFCQRDVAMQLDPLPKDAPAKSNRWTPVIALMALLTIPLLIIANLGTTNATPDGNVPAVPDTPRLELLASNGYETAGGAYHKVEGQVKNLTTDPIDNIKVVVTWYGKDGTTFIASDDALIDYRPLMPGQTSPFTTITSSNPLMGKYGLEFATIRGAVIAHRDSRGTNK